MVVYSISHLYLTFQYQDGAIYAVCLQYDYFPLQLIMCTYCSNTTKVNLLPLIDLLVIGDVFNLSGDCTSMTHFMNGLSLYYQGIVATFKPSFDKYYQPDPVLEEVLIPQVLPSLYYQEHAMKTSIALKSLETMLSTTSRIAVRISANQVRAIHDWITKHTTGSP